MEQTVAEYLAQKKYESSLTSIAWSIIASKRSLKDLELDLIRFKQEYRNLPPDQKDEVKDFIKFARQFLKAIETYLE